MENLLERIIGILAYKSWLKRGKPIGSDRYDWFGAEHIVKETILALCMIIFCIYLFFILRTPGYSLIQYSPLVAIIIIILNWHLKWGMTPGRLLVILSIFIAIMTLSIQNKSLLKEIDHFELSNRPFISADSPIIKMTDKELNVGNLPELSFIVGVSLKNHGKLPAYIKNVECVAKSISGDVCEPFMPRPKDKEKQVENFDLFPTDTKSFLLQPHINIDAIMRLMVESIQNIDIRNKHSEFWGRNANEIISELEKHKKPFYLIFQIEYYMIGDDKKIKPYFYSVQFRVDQNGAHYFKSNSRKWFDFNNNGIMRWLN